jgi:Family of unknown function (DUF6134)
MKALLLSFAVLLDGREIGTHTFALKEDGVLVSKADFQVRVLGIPFYRYRHEATERWRGECLESLVARTDDNGEKSAVDWRAPGAGCELSFAYWNPRILKQKRLLNAQTGELEPVSVMPLGQGRYRISGRKLDVDLAYEQGKWVALETTVGGRRLRYRLESSS